MPGHTALLDALKTRFGDLGDAQADADLSALTLMAMRGSCRSFKPDPVPTDLIRILSATALSSPTKSDLQQRDIIELRAPDKRRALAALIPGQSWIANAPSILIFCGNNRRQRLLHEWHDVPFDNDHFDAVFNAIGDAAIALGAFVTAAEAVGLGCCPISAVRNEAQAVSDLLALPDHVFPFAGLAVGYPEQTPEISMRLPLRVTAHVDGYSEAGLREAVEAYDAQRVKNRVGSSTDKGWSHDKTRQYSAPERADFGAFIRTKGFDLT
ncbi:MAG: nitroreductase family protein [Pseudomonadota bacterium]